jgi:phenylalanyl-tRNA synthetase beta chain
MGSTTSGCSTTTTSASSASALNDQAAAKSEAPVKFSHEWLLDYVPVAAPPEEIGRRLTAAGLPLDGIAWRDSSNPRSAIYDLDVFTNRPDCMNHLGVARELAALYELALRPPAIRIPAGGPTTSQAVRVEIDAPSLCARYAARCVLGVRVGPSPDWMKARLEAIGQRSINNVVDATNFVLWEMGQPLHPFDRDRLEGQRIVVRTARAGETLVTLDGVERRLASDTLVIADARAPVALAGIMGGHASEIGPQTKNVFLESAWFDPVTVRRTSKALGLHTDASHRFERGADPDAAVRALDRAAALIADVAGGQVTDPPIDQQVRLEPARVATLRPARAAVLLGRAPTEAAMRSTLERLGFAVDAGDPARWSVQVPSFRRDVSREVDLIEEIARHTGYDAIPAALPCLHDPEAGRNAGTQFVERVRAALLGAGLTEAINFVMADRDECLLLEPQTPPVAIDNPLSSAAASLRTTLLPGLLRNAAHNLNRGASGCHLFEVGRVFQPAAGRPHERLRAAGLLTGRAILDHWSLGRREADLYDARGVVELLVERLEWSHVRFSSDRISADAPVAGPRVLAGGSDAGGLGEVPVAVRRRFELERPVFAFEVDLDLCERDRPAGRRFAGLPRFPAVRRDLALVVDEAVTVTELETAIRGASALPIAALQVFDRYKGEGVPRGHASVALQIVFQHPERTLEADEVQAAQETIVKALAERVGARLRG